ncbi:amino acid adenylation domain-containing protein [Microcoleus sp. FACHB-SPT15]|uniref:non-ribosomal peptide synthetase n=1 Tax=Microcoleus sp. FACHB-SPT15 TaxID=2692830 RepID=UPI00177B7548|nr:non-ribosomal peptide synthetase [Microcoleus sp. FACHB-SPT15]MBD1809019.1 amino acid adenylation domain-containing protein [Microcoleus sp. FACHB-SPT15]
MLSDDSLTNAQPRLNIPEEEVFIFPASFAQARLWFIDQLVPGNTFYNVPTALRLTGSLNYTALEQTFNEIVRRHEVLRTRFGIVEGQLVQAIPADIDVPTSSINLSLIDLRELPAEEREHQAKRLVAEESQRPFDLAVGPLLRLMLLKLDETEHILLLNLHHIVSDDWSTGVLMRELSAIYTAFVLEVPSPLPELPLQYADFAHWQREWLQGELETQLSYWQQQLDGVPILNLPCDRPKAALHSYRGATKLLELPPSLSEALEKLSQQEGVTLFMTLLAAFQILLYRYTQQEDIAVGSPIANRNRSEIEGLIGFFVNSLVLRTDLSGAPTFQELLGRVREVTLGAYAHQDLPFEKLVEELQPERSLSRHPLFQVVFALQNAPTEALELPGLTLNPLTIDFKTTRFDLEFNLWKASEGFRSLWGERWEHSEGIRGVVVYNTDLFDEATISRMLGHFKTLLEGIVANPQTKIADLPLLSVAEYHQLTVSWNDTFADYPQNQCIHQLFEAQVEKTPDATAVIFEDKQLTYRELNSYSNKLAHHLQKLGVGSEALVGICMERSVEMIVGCLSILKAGGAYLPLDPNYPQERLRFMIEDSQISVLLTQAQEKLVEQLPDVVTCTYQDSPNPRVICLDTDWNTITQESSENLTSSVTSDNLAYVIYTSGSTGKPKGVAVPHKAVNRLLFNTNYITLDPNDKIAQASNTSFDAATFEIWGALLHGAQLVGISRDITLSPQDFAQQLRQKGISVLFLTTALFQQIVRAIPDAFATLRCLLFGGEAVDPRWVRKVLKQGAPQQLLNVYGPTEGTTFSSYYWVQDVPEEATSIPIGRPITNTQIYLLDEQLQPVPIGVLGELYIGGDGLAQGYLNRPELTSLAFIPNPFSQQPGTRLYKTGDLARYRSDGNIEFLGRSDNQVKIRGFRIELAEIEAVLSQHPAVAEAVVIVQEDIPADKHLIAYIVPNKGQAPTSSELRQFSKEKLPNYMVPSIYMILESLPLTPNGKVDRRVLPAVDTLSLDPKEDYVAPRTTVEEELAEIWAKILGKQQVGVHDNFFELGGHSLLATQLTSRIRDRFKVELPVRILFEAPTVGMLARHIEAICWAAKNSDTTSSTGNEREEVEF